MWEQCKFVSLYLVLGQFHQAVLVCATPCLEFQAYRNAGEHEILEANIAMLRFFICHSVWIALARSTPDRYTTATITADGQ